MAILIQRGDNYRRSSADARYCRRANDLSDLSSDIDARLNLGLGEMARLGVYVLEYPPAIPIGWGLDGASPPDAKIVLTSTFKIPVREFRGDTGNQDVYIPWKAPRDLSGGIVRYRVSGYVTNAAAPADGKTVNFALAGSARGPSQPLSKAMGAAGSATFTADGTYAQYDYWETNWSGDVTITDLATYKDVMFQLTRNQASTQDTYEQNIGVAWVELEITKRIGN